MTIESERDGQSELTANRDMGRDARDQWTTVIRTQIHFNEIIHRTRQMTATVVVAAYGAAAASFFAKPAALLTWGWTCMPSMRPAIPIVLLGFVLLGVGYTMDRLYYYRLLLAAVKVGEQLETRFELPAKLSTTLSTAVGRTRAAWVIHLFYLAGIAIGLLLIWVINSAQVVSV